MKQFDIAILGAGASGCMCALQCDENKSVVMIDKVSVPAKKLQATGNGRCNLTNEQISPNDWFYNEDIEQYFSRFDQNDTLDFFAANGLVFYADEEGRVYPFSNYAKSVIDVIGNTLAKHKNITYQLGQEIVSLKKENELFVIETDKDVLHAKKVVVALGSKASQTIIETFGIQHKKFIPSLCAIKTQNTKLLSGTKVFPARVDAYTVGGTHLGGEVGEILFKDSGLSGIATFNLSALFARQGAFEGTITLDIAPEIEKEELFDTLCQRRKLALPISKFFEGMFANPVAYFILNKCKLDETQPCSSLTDKQIEQFASLIKRLEFEVKDCYDNNQIYAGGVLLEHLDENLQSKKVPNLYFCGEACNVDGVCGGYNLQWAWTSGYIAGRGL